ncbi:uncharacterized protein LOC106673290 isoform X1 [Cimex lectularius]|uniref:DNA-directed RNA polymerase III subunit RPC9 n=1 Tax=Cimex lectularius TaxID=79782 RepID=A0A8I6SC87_CIMLE|nr:uncharacterized protein LOC106673290 isoform X1 [Cimex lectularius]
MIKRTNPEVASLSNCEVLSLLNELKDNSQISTKSGNQFATILYETSQYLHNLHAQQSEQDVRNLLKALLDFPIPLTYREKLMIVNTPPKTALELSLIMRNYDERLTEQEVEDLLSIIAKHSKEPLSIG